MLFRSSVEAEICSNLFRVPQRDESIDVGDISVRLPSRMRAIDLGPPWPDDPIAFPGLAIGADRPASNSGDTVHGATASAFGPAVSDLDHGDEAVEDFFGQLWVIPSSPVRPSPPRRSILCWIRKGIADKDLAISDCFPTVRSDILHQIGRAHV